jgi:hypothetical protein
MILSGNTQSQFRIWTRFGNVLNIMGMRAPFMWKSMPQNHTGISVVN